ncbi:MAG: DUF4339 domain-containing protein [Pirellulales bacterium]|nr:DUF4339 domain-containing protein [Pirellulales bacterium]
MPIETRCGKCGGRFRVADKYAGKRIKCPKCQQGTIEVPATAESKPAPPGEPAKASMTPQRPMAAEKPSSPAPPTTPSVPSAPSVVPSAPSEPSAPLVAAAPPTSSPSSVGSPSKWYLQTEEGDQYGPVSREELDEWLGEGRIDASCQLLREDWSQWKWAEDVFAELGGAAAEPQQAAAAQGQPFAGIGKTTPQESEPGPYASPQVSTGDATPVGGGPAGGLGVRGRRALSETKPWVVFLAILGFVIGGIGVLTGLLFLAASAVGAGLPGILIGLCAFVGPVITLVLAYYLFSYGQRIAAYLRTDRPADLEAALTAQKSFWKLAGLVTAVYLGFCVLVMVAVMALGGLGAILLQNAAGGPPGP